MQTHGDSGDSGDETGSSQGYVAFFSGGNDLGRTGRVSAILCNREIGLMLWYTFIEHGGEPIQGRFPVLNRHRPFLANVTQRQIIQLDQGFALGKKNWLFSGSERAGHRAAAIQSLLGTAKLNSLDPYAWLRETLEKLPVWPNRRIDELLPLRQTAAA